MLYTSIPEQMTTSVQQAPGSARGWGGVGGVGMTALQALPLSLGW